MYIDDIKYSSQDDLFDYKLNIFYDNYDRARLLLEGYIKAYPTILKEAALQYYYHNRIVLGVLTFEQAIEITRNYFETSDVKQSRLRK